jgi:RNA polymerase sigma factor (sigma-70 family)
MAAVPDVGRADKQVSSRATHQLYEQYGGQIYAFCLQRLRSREEAEDAVQTTFLNAFRALQKGTQTRFEQAWLYKIAHHVCVERSQSSGRRLQVESPSDLHVLQEVASAHTPQDPEQLIGIEDALAGMPAKQRKAILLREWQGLSYREVGEELGLSQSAVEMLIFRARRTLAQALEQPQTGEGKKVRGGRMLNFGSLITGLKTLFSGGAAVKMVAVAVTAGAVAVGAKPAEHALMQPRAHARAPRTVHHVHATPISYAGPIASVPARTPAGNDALKRKHAPATVQGATKPLAAMRTHVTQPHRVATISDPTTVSPTTAGSTTPPSSAAPTAAPAAPTAAAEPTAAITPTPPANAPAPAPAPKPNPGGSGGGSSGGSGGGGTPNPKGGGGTGTGSQPGNTGSGEQGSGDGKSGSNGKTKGKDKSGDKGNGDGHAKGNGDGHGKGKGGSGGDTPTPATAPTSPSPTVPTQSSTPPSQAPTQTTPGTGDPSNNPQSPSTAPPGQAGDPGQGTTGTGQQGPTSGGGNSGGGQGHDGGGGNGQGGGQGHDGGGGNSGGGQGHDGGGGNGQGGGDGGHGHGHGK